MGLLTITLMAVLPAINPALASDEFVNMQEDFKHVLQTCTTVGDTAYVLEMGAIFDIVDHRFYRNTLRRSQSLKGFRFNIERFQSDRPKFWEIVVSNTHAAMSICGTRVGLPRGERDARWDWFLVKGLPTVSWVVDAAIESSGQRRPATCYLYTWEDGTGVALYSDTVGGYPIRLAPPVRKVPDSPIPIFPDVRVVVLPNPDGTFSVGLTASVACDQFNAESMERDSVEYRFRFVEPDGYIQMHESAVRLGLARLVTSISDKPQDFTSMGFGTFRVSRPGVCHCEIEIDGSRLNHGREKIDISVPSPQASPRVSDIAFLAGELPTGNIAPGISRNGRLIYSEAVSRFRIDSVLNPYMEIWPPHTTCARVTAYLLPVSGRAHPGAPRVRVGDIGGVQAVAGEEYAFSLQEITPLIPENQNPRTWQEYRVFDSSYAVTEDPFVFDDRIPLHGVHRGSYVLRISAADCTDSTHIGTAWTRIEIQ